MLPKILPQVAENPTVINVLGSSPKSYLKSYNAFEEWTQGSGVSEVITKLNVEPLTDRGVIAQKLNKKKYFDKLPLGWWVSGLDLKTMKRQTFGQFKPKEPIQSPKAKKPAKYLTPTESEYDAIALEHPDEDYWQRVIDDPSIPIALDEGTKKAGMLMTLGFVALALCGVWMGLKKGGKELVNNLALLAVQGRPITIVFDADLAYKTGIQLALKALATVLKQRGCIVFVAIIPLELEANGIDDVRIKHGEEMVKKIMADAIPYSQWLKSLEVQMSQPVTSGEKSYAKPPKPRVIAAEIAEQYGNQWKFDNQQKTWRIWTGKEWEKMEIGNFETLLQSVVDSKNIDYTGDAYLTDVLKLLTKRLRVAKWEVWNRKRYTNFNNCVLDAHTFKKLEHLPGMGFTSHLPYDYKPLIGTMEDPLETLRANCPNIHKWMRLAMQDDSKKMLKLLAIVNGTLRFRFHDVQMFVHLVGKPRAGKGTFSRLLEKVVGDGNFAACQLDRLKDGSTVASIIDKQLVVFADERKPTGIDSILSFTGGDAVSYREVYRPASHAFFYGLLLICSNKPIFVGDTTGLDRRLCLVDFNNPISTEQRDRFMEKSFDNEIPALIATALTMPDDLVTQIIEGTGKNQISEFKAKEWEMKYQTDSIAAFFNDELIMAEGSTLKTSDLYGNYKLFCELAGLRPLSLVKFPSMFHELCTELGFGVTWEKTRGRSYFHGVRLRTEADNHPTYSETLSEMTGVESVNDGGLTGVVRGLNPAPVGNCGGFNQNMAKLSESLETSENVLETSQNFSANSEDSVEIKSSGPPQPPSIAEVSHQQEIQPPSNPCTTPAQPPSFEVVATPKKHKEFEIDERVIITEHVSPMHKGAVGKIIGKTYLGHSYTKYQVQLDKKSHGQHLVVVHIPQNVDGLVYLINL